MVENTDINVNLKIKKEEDNLKSLRDEFKLIEKRNSFEKRNNIQQQTEIINRLKYESKEKQKQNKLELQHQKKVNNDTKKWIKSLSGFSTTLPLMFGFQTISQQLKSLVQPSLDLVGASQMYQDYLSLKYIDTGISELEKNVELMESLGDSSEYAQEGQNILSASALSQAIELTAQFATMGAAIGRIIPLLGESGGALLGVEVAVDLINGSFKTLEGVQATTFLGLGAATSTYVSGPLSSLAKMLQLDIPSASEIAGQRLTAEFNQGMVSVDKYISKLGEIDPEIISDVYPLLDEDKKKVVDNYIASLKGESPIKIKIITEVEKAQQEEKTRKTVKNVLEGVGYAALAVTPAALSAGVIPGIVTGGIGVVALGLSKINALNPPEYAADNGGVIPGPIGAPMPILAHGGETVLPTHKQDVGGFGNQSIVINISGVSSPNDVQRAIDNSILQLKTEIRRLN